MKFGVPLITVISAIIVPIMVPVPAVIIVVIVVVVVVVAAVSTTPAPGAVPITSECCGYRQFTTSLHRKR